MADMSEDAIEEVVSHPVVVLQPTRTETKVDEPAVSSVPEKIQELAMLAPMMDTMPTNPESKAEEITEETTIPPMVDNDPAEPESNPEVNPKLAEILKFLELPTKEGYAAIRALDPLDVIECAYQSPLLKNALRDIKIHATSIHWTLENPACCSIILNFSRQSAKSQMRWMRFPDLKVKNWEYDHWNIETNASSTIRIDTTREMLFDAMNTFSDVLEVEQMYLSMSESFPIFKVLKTLPKFKKFKISFQTSKLSSETLMDFLKTTEVEHLIVDAEMDTGLEPKTFKNRKIEIRWSDCLNFDVFDPLVCKIIEVKAPQLTVKMANDFLKFWKDGGLEKLEFLSLEGSQEVGKEGIEVLAPEEVLEGLDSRITLFGSKKASTPYLSSWSNRVGPETWVNNPAYDIQRSSDGRWATVIFNPNGIHFLVWHPKYLKDQDDDDNEFVFV